MSVLTKARLRADNVISTAQSHALMLKGGGVDLSPAQGLGLGQFAGDMKNRRRYAINKGWLYSAVHALALEASKQPARVARLEGATPNPEAAARPLGSKAWALSKMPADMRAKAAQQELELLADHPLVDVLEQPNPVQSRLQFTYAHVANVNLTGQSYIVADTDGDRPVFYALPTTWVRPQHDDGPFSSIKIVNPKNPEATDDTPAIPRGMFARAYLPDPSDPLAALSPAASQMNAVRIDDHIQSSQEAFFENGIWPGYIVTVGKDPHPDVAAAFRPRLSGTQRRQVHAAIHKVAGGIRQYGAPAIVDGLIEKFERMSATQNEMGWEKSEDKVADRILSAFGVHKFILGLQLNVGGYAQAYGIRERFYSRVNCFTAMLSRMMTELAGPLFDADKRLLVWWEELVASDPSIESREWTEARKIGDVSKNEFRARLGLPPDEDAVEETSPLLSTVGGMNGVGQWMSLMGQGQMPETVAQLMELFFKIPLAQAQAIVGRASEEETIEDATEALELAVSALGVSPKMIASKLVGASG